ncbi:MAG: flagellar basal body L-ring protein FlgH [Vicinamibacterales bacterium]
MTADRTRKARRCWRPAGTLLALLAAVTVTVPVSAAGKSDKKAPQSSDNYDELYARYLVAARSQPAAPPDQNRWLTSLMTDLRARNVNDIVTIRVTESIIGTGTADSNISKETSGSSALPGFFGLEGKLPGFIDPTNLAGLNSDSEFKGAGSTSRASALTATMTARVADVLPSGDLVLEGVREIDINGDRQIVVLTGVARVADITPGNVISSQVLGQLRIRYFGRGLMKDSLSPGWLIRVLNKIF